MHARFTESVSPVYVVSINNGLTNFRVCTRTHHAALK